jgi:hypothetical protein
MKTALAQNSRRVNAKEGDRGCRTKSSDFSREETNGSFDNLSASLSGREIITPHASENGGGIYQVDASESPVSPQ